MPDGQLYKLSIVAEGELRDKDGKVISTEPLTAETIITEDQALKLAQAAAEEQTESTHGGRPLSNESG